MKKITAAFVLLWMLPCCGCTSDPGSSSAATTETSTALPVTTAVTSSAETVSATTVTESDESEPAPENQATDSAEPFQGGIGDERNAATPLPEYFAYRFQPDSFSARLAGGNYQTISYDLSEAIQHTIEADYYLDDYDSDGDYDLYLPVKYEDSKVSRYAVFCWDSDSEKFLTEPVMFGTVS